MLQTYYFKKKFTILRKNLLFSLKTYYFTDELTILYCNAHLLIVTILEKFTYYFRSLYLLEVFDRLPFRYFNNCHKTP